MLIKGLPTPHFTVCFTVKNFESLGKSCVVNCLKVGLSIISLVTNLGLKLELTSGA